MRDVNDILFRINAQTMAGETHGLKKFVQVLYQEGVIDGGSKLDVAYMTRAEVAI
jgi:hypothetical protein